MPNLMSTLMQQHRMGGNGPDYTMGSQGGFQPQRSMPASLGFQPRQPFAAPPLQQGAQIQGPPMPQQGPPMPAVPKMQPDYQSNNLSAHMMPQGPMMDGGQMAQSINFGDPHNAADFFRADQLMQRFPGLLGG